MTPEHLFATVVQVAVLLFAVSVHESAHGLAALKCGDTTARDLGRITLNPLRHLDPVGSLLIPGVLAATGAPVFGWAKPVPVNLTGVPNPRKANLIVSAAGPLSNLALALAFGAGVALLRPFIRLPEASSVVVPLLFVAVYGTLVNSSLALFNLLPIAPLDGFGVLESLAPFRLYPALFWLRRWGFAILALFVFTGAVKYVLGPPQAVLLRWLLGESS